MNGNQCLFTFENIVFLTNQDLLTLLKEIDNVTLLKACKRCDEIILHRILSQLSLLARDYFFDDLAKMGSVPDEEVLSAQNRIGIIFSDAYLKGRLQDWNGGFAA